MTGTERSNVIAVCSSPDAEYGWQAICPDYDIASDGRNADEALDMAQDAWREVRAVCEETGRPFEPRPVPWDDLAAFVRDAVPVNGNVCVAARYYF